MKLETKIVLSGMVGIAAAIYLTTTIVKTHELYIHETIWQNCQQTEAPIPCYTNAKRLTERAKT